MNNMITVGGVGLPYSPAQIQHLRQKFRNLENAEFNQFLTECVDRGIRATLNLLIPVVFVDYKSKERTLQFIETIESMRSRAEATDDYRPDEDDPVFKYDEKLKSPTNPLGIERVSVSLFKWKHGDWHRVKGSARWEEFAKTKRGDTGPVLTKMWRDMPEHMLAKCAEGHALRKAFPALFTGTFAEGELNHTENIVDLSPSEWAEKAAQEERLSKINAPFGFTVDWKDGEGLQRVEFGKMHDLCMEFLNKHRDKPALIADWQQSNRLPLQEFWVRDKDAALDLKKQIEDAASDIYDRSTEEATV